MYSQVRSEALSFSSRKRLRSSEEEEQVEQVDVVHQSNSTCPPAVNTQPVLERMESLILRYLLNLKAKKITTRPTLILV